MTLRDLVIVLVTCGCGLFGPKAPEPCSNDEMLDIQAKYLTRVKASCVKGLPLSSCPDYPAIRAERDARVTRWVACSSR